MGDWLGDDWIVTRGLRPGDRASLDGVQKIAPGMPVKVVPPGEVKATPPPPPAAN